MAAAVCLRLNTFKRNSIKFAINTGFTLFQVACKWGNVAQRLPENLKTRR
ncbi:hypothetical protein EIKCOROL_02357 [Eikenella corrodens ATCC 23834]|uniref:Uncharacterized protein n=1 Tax=Eikenella corrodens ATCC 23834 TaxID=546274 RepID=C0DY95_EIKCO|nr:hypothetical protein EIKCOROL_02357 [Eikenella corrodens ATCC 23834]